ncbi:MAG: glycerol-3-phosphate dehydrogenase/oxidase [Steroidobacteraceae bacterium]
MHRKPAALTERQFDVLVVGGGAAGAAAAREACLRGCATALIAREDFGAGSSAQCFKVVHGGIRYLQHADFARLRASCRERSILLRIAPHLVAPLPFAIPTYGHGRSGRGFLRAGMLAYDACTVDRNRGLPDPARRIARTRFLSRAEALACFPTLEPHGLTGAAVFEDGQMYNPPRLVLAFIAAAVELGAVVANHVEAEHLLIERGRVIGVQARDRLSAERFDIRARVTINAAGPWAEGLLGPTAAAPATYSRDACFIVARQPAAMALAVQGATRDQDALLAREARHLFLVPWRGHTLVGVWHAVVPRDPDAVRLSQAELACYLEEINAAHPALRLHRAEVRAVCYGLVPFGDAARQRPGALSFGKESRIIDHRRRGLPGLVSAISVRYTVARRDAAAAVDLACAQLGPARLHGDPRSTLQDRCRGLEGAARAAARASASCALPGGDIADFGRFERALAQECRGTLPDSVLASLARNHGTRAARVLALAAADPALGESLPGTSVLAAEIVQAARTEMAQRLADVVFRRTELGTAGHPGEPALAAAEALLRRELGWNAGRAAEERDATEREFARYLAEAPTAPGRALAEDAVSGRQGAPESPSVRSVAAAALRRA